jgi:uncharacterized membrane protein YhiD involved in acid resistance
MNKVSPSRSSTISVLGMVLGLLVLLAVFSAIGPLMVSRPPATDAAPSASGSSYQQFERAIAAAAAQGVPFSANDLGMILTRLVLAAILGLAVAFRGRRSEPGVVHTNMIIAFSGALAMMIVGSDLARAFGLVGASSIVRYRTPVRDPQALAALFVSMGAGIAVGVGLIELAIVATIVVILIDLALTGGGRRLSGGWFRPERNYELTLETEQALEMLVQVREIFNELRINHTLVDYEVAKKGDTDSLGLLVGLPDRADTEKLTLQLLSAGARSVSWRLSKDA